MSYLRPRFITALIVVAITSGMVLGSTGSPSSDRAKSSSASLVPGPITVSAVIPAYLNLDVQRGATPLLLRNATAIPGESDTLGFFEGLVMMAAANSPWHLSVTASWDAAALSRVNIRQIGSGVEIPLVNGQAVDVRPDVQFFAGEHRLSYNVEAAGADAERINGASISFQIQIVPDEM